MKVALFGGSFNPIQNAHLQIANELIEKKIVDEVWLIPCGNHPFCKELADGKDRMNMINLAIESNSKLKALDIEISSEKISFTSETIKFLRNKFKKIKFYFIIGLDILKDFHKWHDFEYLKENIEFILVTRPEFELTNKLGIKINYILEIKNKISSTKIRNLLNNSESIRGLVPEKTKEYIQQEGLYHGI